MQSGRISQCAPPHVMYDRPESRFGGWFLGNPGMNFVSPRSRENGFLRFDVLPAALAYPAAVAGEVSLGIRPEHVEVLAAAGADTVAARVVRSSINIGGQNLVSLSVGETKLKAKTAPGAAQEAAGWSTPSFSMTACGRPKRCGGRSDGRRGHAERAYLRSGHLRHQGRGTRLCARPHRGARPGRRAGRPIHPAP
jgi:ABC-type sugar transport system ATPase subunit